MNVSKLSDQELQQHVVDWSEAMFSESEGSDPENLGLEYAPKIQLAQNELTSRFVKRTTRWALGIAGLSLFVSLTALALAIITRS